MKKLSFVIPCYGSELTIEGVIAEINSVMALRPEYSFETICVNDCSPDNVLEKLKKIATEQDTVTVVDFAKNMGKHAAVMAGFSFVTGDYIVNLDDDGQCPLDKLWNLVDTVENGSDIAIAKYPVKKQSVVKNFGSSVNAFMSHILLNKPNNLQFSNFGVIKRFIIDEILKYHNPYPYLEGLFLRTTSKIINVEMDERERTAGTGHFTFRKSLSLWLNGFTAFSIKPLRIATVAGFVFAVIGFVYALSIVIRKLFIYPEMAMGYSSTMAILLLIGGMLMLMLGLIGEYIGRIYISINNSPQYVIREVIKSEDGNKR
ncbi:MAG: glycosyltransferase [Tannerella sp.]|jgi:undecaprenyl-phosphate 4-deoxy-4-formamido-L-arabinose transferase|nr:glycosyltransferase [Tannerella sp.]